MKNSEIYISIDIETDGPIPGPHSMLSIGNAAFDQFGRLVDTWEANLKTLPGAQPDSKTKKEFWDKNPKAWAACRQDPQPIAKVMSEYVAWLKKLEKQHKGKVVAVCAPSGFDFTFVYWYLMKFAKYSPFSFSCIDVKTYAMSLLNLPYRKCGKRSFPKDWFNPKAKHTHVALDDAIEQGEIFCKMKEYHLRIMTELNYSYS